MEMSRLNRLVGLIVIFSCYTWSEVLLPIGVVEELEGMEVNTTNNRVGDGVNNNTKSLVGGVNTNNGKVVEETHANRSSLTDVALNANNNSKVVIGSDTNNISVLVTNQTRRVVVHNGRTVAELELGDHGKVIFCSLRIMDERSKSALLKEIFPNDTFTQWVKFETMMVIVEACDNHTKEAVDDDANQDDTDEEVSFWSLITSGIVPGTLWCGVNDIAEDFFSLGTNSQLDRCCRAHDHCPQKIKPFARKEGLVNASPYTKSHCDCDNTFYSCLKASNSSAGDSVARFYFNFLNLQCIDHRHPKRCATWKNSTVVVDKDLEEIHGEDPALRNQEQQIENNVSTKCLQWVPDLDEAPELSFIKNSLKY